MCTAVNNKGAHISIIFVVFLLCAYAILPMSILGEDYIFTIHDGLDSYAGMVQMVHDKGLYFHMNQKMPIMNGIEGKYFCLTYNLYDFFNCVFGFLAGQICIRIMGVLLGFFSMQHLLKYLFPPDQSIKYDLIYLISIVYVITPCAPNRMLAFASLPFVIWLFLFLSKKEKLTCFMFIMFLVPFFSIIDAILFFVIGFWFIAFVINWIKQRKINKNLWIGFIILCISTVFVNCNFIRIALIAEQTNRGLLVYKNNGFNWSLFKEYLLEGQYHAATLHRYFLLPFALIGLLYALYQYKINKDCQIKNCIVVLLFGFIMWIFSAFIMAFQESGYSTGILIIDGFGWGRIIALMRIVWYIMFGAVVFLIPYKRIFGAVFYGIIFLQLVYIIVSQTTYNDTYETMCSLFLDNNENAPISFKEFFSEELFNEIKEDINYNNEGVVAYGYHPSVLLYNGFNTLDGYFTLHSMEYQLQFREIIEPALQHYPNWAEYYDGWGGRMYLYGELSFVPTRNKDIPSVPLYINTSALEKYGGKYILSRAEISNSDDIGINLINRYDTEESLYHIYLYSVK